MFSAIPPFYLHELSLRRPAASPATHKSSCNQAARLESSEDIAVAVEENNAPVGHREGDVKAHRVSVQPFDVVGVDITPQGTASGGSNSATVAVKTFTTGNDYVQLHVKDCEDNRSSCRVTGRRGLDLINGSFNFVIWEMPSHLLGEVLGY